MKRCPLKFILFISWMAGMPPQGAWSQGQRALLVGVANYQTETDWASPLAAHIDLEILSAALRRQGFAEEDIAVLKDPTKRELVDALVALAEQAEPGGAAVFHFSGHGQPVVDVDGDEASGLDQSLVPADANRLPGSPWTNERGEAEAYFGQNHLIDDELTSYLEAIRRKLGPDGQLICILDACHAGSATRAPGMTRGTTDVMLTSPDDKQPAGNKVAALEPWIDRSNSDSTLAPLIAFYACASNEVNHEYTSRLENGRNQNIGSLSYSLAAALERLPNEQKTWNDVQRILERIMAEIVPNQTPYAEGDMSLGVFTGLRQSGDHQIRVLDVRGDSVMLSGGSIMNLKIGTRIELMDLSAIGSEPVAAEVVHADFLKSTALIQKGSFAPEDLDAIRVSMTLPALGAFSLIWSCEGCQRSVRKKLVRHLERMHGMRQAAAGESAHLRIIQSGESTIEWKDDEGNLLAVWSEGLDAGFKSSEFPKQLQRWSQAIELKSLTHTDKAFDVVLGIKRYADMEAFKERDDKEFWRSNAATTMEIEWEADCADEIIEFNLLQTNFRPTKKWYYSIYAIDACEVHPLTRKPYPERTLGRVWETVDAFPMTVLAGDDRVIRLKLIACTQPIDFDSYFVGEQSQVELDEPHPSGSRGSSQVQLSISTFDLRILN